MLLVGQPKSEHGPNHLHIPLNQKAYETTKQLQTPKKKQKKKLSTTSPISALAKKQQ